MQRDHGIAIVVLVVVFAIRAEKFERTRGVGEINRGELAVAMFGKFAPNHYLIVFVPAVDVLAVVIIALSARARFVFDEHDSRVCKLVPVRVDVELVPKPVAREIFVGKKFARVPAHVLA